MVKKSKIPLFFMTFFVCVITPTVDSAVWQLVSRDFESDYYIDSRSIRKSADVFFFKALLKVSSPVYDSGTFFIRQKVNCKKNSIKIISYSTYPSVGTHEPFFHNDFFKPLMPNYVFGSDLALGICKYIKHTKSNSNS